MTQGLKYDLKLSFYERVDVHPSNTYTCYEFKFALDDDIRAWHASHETSVFIFLLTLHPARAVDPGEQGATAPNFFFFFFFFFLGGGGGAGSPPPYNFHN